ncbi:MAG TPA: hypothetical protein VFV93_14120 [Thermomicrobiales bacterium]|jgi:hypothetical protein|nr:hypothetical protein [Thermomicrobiales bacterium]
MDTLAEIGKAILTLGVIGILVILIPILFMFIFTIATSIDERMSR